jgi:transposase
VEALTDENISGEVLDHLGLVSATIDQLGLIEKVDALLPLAKRKGVKVTMGQRVAAMILNGLGFMDTRLYMFEKFLENKPIDRLFGADVQAEHFNDDTLGRCLDAIDEYGVTKFFTEISFSIGVEQGLIGKTMRGDTTTLLVHGEYPENPESSDDKPRPKHGHSKAKRPDLKQMVLHLATTGGAGFPIWMEPHSGNASDKTVLVEAAARMEKFKNKININKDFLYVGDSAFYSGAVKNGGDMKWLSRVPENIKEAKELVERKEEELDWIALEDGYRMQCFDNQYGDVSQRWALIYSQHSYDREARTVDRNIERESKEIEKDLRHLDRETFQCQGDAEKAITKIKNYKYYSVLCAVNAVKGHSGRGRPKKGEEPSVQHFKIETSYERDEEKIARVKRRKGRFILATNDLNGEFVQDTTMLETYKEQSSTEGSFQFIKNNAFEVDSVFLKKPSRITALMAIMCLCLMVYGFSQHKVRSALVAMNETIPNQRNKETQKPRMQWVYRLFHGVQLLTIRTENHFQKLTINLNPLLRRIIGLFGPRAMEIYGLQR